jgi:protein involved in polysaccharide export with SLBB domain
MQASGITVEKALSIAGGLTELSTVKNLTIIQEFTTIDEAGNEVLTTENINNVTLDFQIGINSVIVAAPFENVVRVQGNVYNPGLITFNSKLRLPDYIDLAGGYRPNTIKKSVYVQRANGNIEKTNQFAIIGKKIYAGDTIIIPIDPNPPEFDATAFFADLSSTIANIAAILLIVDNQK